MRRPRSIIWFEWIVVLCLAFNGLQFYNEVFGRIFPSSEAARLRTLSITAFAILIAVNLTLIWLIGRRRSTVAKWLYVALCLARVAISIIVPLVRRHWPTYPLTGQVQLALIAISIWLLFRPEARDWFAGRAPVDPTVFD